MRAQASRVSMTGEDKCQRAAHAASGSLDDLGLNEGLPPEPGRVFGRFRGGQRASLSGRV